MSALIAIQFPRVGMTVLIGLAGGIPLAFYLLRRHRQQRDDEARGQWAWRPFGVPDGCAFREARRPRRTAGRGARRLVSTAVARRAAFCLAGWPARPRRDVASALTRPREAPSPAPAPAPARRSGRRRGLTWLLPAGEFDRREDAATGRDVVVAGTYRPVPAGAGRTCSRWRWPSRRSRRGRRRRRRHPVRRRRVGHRRQARHAQSPRRGAGRAVRRPPAPRHPGRLAVLRRRWARSRTCRKRSSRSCRCSCCSAGGWAWTRRPPWR